MKKLKKYFILLYLIILNLIIIIMFFNNGIILYNNKITLKKMNESTEVSNLNKTINTLQSSHTEYANYIQTNKINLATAITNAGVTTSGDDTFETMIDNVSNILSISTNDATATEEQILTGQTAYVNGNKIIGTMVDRGAVTPTALNAEESYTIPEGYHNGSGKVIVNSLESQTQATATADNISAGKTAWVNGNLITGNGLDIANSSTQMTELYAKYNAYNGATYTYTFSKPYKTVVGITNNGANNQSDYGAYGATISFSGTGTKVSHINSLQLCTIVLTNVASGSKVSFYGPNYSTFYLYGVE